MNSLGSTFFLGELLLGAGAVWLPRLSLHSRKSVHGQELAGIEPRFAEVHAAYKRLYWSVWGLLFAAPILILALFPHGEPFNLSGAILWFELLCPGFAIFEAAFTLWSGVSPVHGRHEWKFRYVYEDSPYLRKLARVQLGLALCLVVVAVLLFFLAPVG